MSRVGGQTEKKSMLQRLGPHRMAEKSAPKKLNRARMRGRRGIRK